MCEGWEGIIRVVDRIERASPLRRGCPFARKTNHEQCTFGKEAFYSDFKTESLPTIREEDPP